jgi:hypothetical protein
MYGKKCKYTQQIILTRGSTAKEVCMYIGPFLVLLSGTHLHRHVRVINETMKLRCGHSNPRSFHVSHRRTNQDCQMVYFHTKKYQFGYIVEAL